VRSLTARRRHVLALVANGHTNAQIGRLLGIHERTVNRHLAEIFQTLGARDRANAVAIALAVGELGVHQIHVPGLEPASTAPREALDGPQARREGANGAREGRGSVRRSQRRTADPGEAAADRRPQERRGRRPSPSLQPEAERPSETNTVTQERHP
jgi:DNA-binding CsgD family transcriptional regulator